jgi:hypothetical protein
MRSGKECYTTNSPNKVSRIPAVTRQTVCGSQKLFDNKAAQAVPN